MGKIISFDTAKLARNKGFHIEINSLKGVNYYNHKGEFNGDILESIKHRNDTDNKYKLVPAPTQTDLQDWLRIEHKIHIQIIYMDDVLKYGFKITTIEDNTDSYDIFNNEFCGGWEYEEALEHGLVNALKIL